MREERERTTRKEREEGGGERENELLMYLMTSSLRGTVASTILHKRVK